MVAKEMKPVIGFRAENRYRGFRLTSLLKNEVWFMPNNALSEEIFDYFVYFKENSFSPSVSVDIYELIFLTVYHIIEKAGL